MFTLEQIKTAHGNVKSGADFPAYINEIKQLGVTGYETFVSDGYTDYYGTNDFKISTVARYNTLGIAGKSNSEQFQLNLKAHHKEKQIIQLFAVIVLNQKFKNGL